MRRILFAILCIILSTSVLTGCGGNDYLVHTATTEAQQEQIRWNQYSQTLFLTAHYAKRPVLLYFHLDGCPACQRMDEETLSDRQIIHLINSSYLPIKINASEDQFDDVADRFELATDGFIWFPSMIISSSTNTQEEISRSTGFVDPALFKSALEFAVTIDTLLRLEKDLDEMLKVITDHEEE